MQFTINPPNVQMVDGRGFVTTQWYRWFSRVTNVLGQDAVAAIQSAPIITYAPTDALTNEKTLQQGPGISFTSTPSAFEISLSASGVAAGNYGSASQTLSFSVDQYGRILSVTSFPLNTNNITEGATNLFFTQARARASVSATGAGLSYNSGTGVFSLNATLQAYAGGDTPSAFTLGIVDSVDAAAWRAAIGAGTGGGSVTSVAASGGTTGLSFTGSPITTSGTLNLTGTLSVANGGTGVTTSTGTGAGVHATRPQFTSTIGVGAAASASGSGVSFPATQSPSTDPNTLDDYEEGATTPTPTAVSGTFTSATSAVAYTKIGREVTAIIRVSIVTNGSAAIGVLIPLPFAASTAGGNGSGRDGTTGKMLQATIDPSGTSVLIVNYDNTYAGGNGVTLSVVVTYFV